MANIQYISVGEIEQHNGTHTSTLASLRYRILIPAQHLGRRHSIQIIRPPTKTDTWPLNFINDTSSDIIIFSKTLHLDNETLAKARRSLGQSVVLDVCDNYFDHLHHVDKWRAHFITMCHLATYIIASTPILVDAIKQYTGRDAVVISDPVEGIKNTPCFAPTFPRLKLLWFGHPTNGMSLINIMDDLLALSQTIPLQLTVVTGPYDKFENYLHDFNKHHGAILPINLKYWSLETTWQSINDCDLVIIPTLPNEFSRAKSPNRLIEALWGGKFVVANAIPSYQSYSPFCWLGEKINDGICYAINNSTLVQQQIKQGQNYVSTHHSPYIIANAWENALHL